MGETKVATTQDSTATAAATTITVDFFFRVSLCFLILRGSYYLCMLLARGVALFQS